MLRKRGITLDQYHAKCEAQDFACGICEEVTMLVVDHNHETGKTRGLLCNPCNKALGFFRDSLANLTAARDYLAQGA